MIELNNFTGTQEYHKLTLFSNLVATDGIAYLCQEAKCYWLVDIVASVQSKKIVMQNNRFLVWRVVKNKTKPGCKVEAYTDCEEDGSYPKDKRVYVQLIHYTDFPFNDLGDEFEFYQCGDVLLLKSEY